MVLRHVILAICLQLALTSTAFADAYDDCVLNGMKGVTTDNAARLVALACRHKVDDDKAKSNAAAFGSELSATDFTLSTAPGDISAGPEGYISQVLKNTSATRTITYASLQVKDGDYYDRLNARAKTLGIDANGLADMSEKYGNEEDGMRTYFYKMTLPPGKSVRLNFKVRPGKFWSKTLVVLGRDKQYADSFLNSDSYVMPEGTNPLQ